MLLVTPSRQNFYTHDFLIVNANNGLIVNAYGIREDGFYQRTFQRKTVFIDTEGNGANLLI